MIYHNELHEEIEMIKKNFNIIINSIYVTASVFLLLTGACVSQENVRTAEITTSKLPVYSIPQEKKEDWGKIQNRLEQERLICAEHCAFETKCMDKCKKAYKARMDREYQQILR
jgi:hypothetical protein